MTFDEIIAQLQQAQGDPERLALATVELTLAGHPPALKAALEAAAVPHWFNAEILAHLLEVELAEASRLEQQLTALPMVEPFPARKGWNVHEATRLALRRRLHAEHAERFFALSARAASLMERSGQMVEYQVEEIYHRLSSAPPQGADLLKSTYESWERGSLREATQALA